jgi:hypothetical protein
MAHFVAWKYGTYAPGERLYDELLITPSEQFTCAVGLWTGSDTLADWRFEIHTSSQEPGTASSKARVAPASTKQTRQHVQLVIKGGQNGDCVKAYYKGQLFAKALPLRVVAEGEGANAKALAAGSRDRCELADLVYPLKKAYGPRMGVVSGLVIHITDKRIQNLRVLQGWDNQGFSAHFAIDRSGQLAQYVALCYQAWAHGPANGNWIGVEMEGNATMTGKGADEMTIDQLNAVSDLFWWLHNRYGFSRQLATPFAGPFEKMGPTISKTFEQASVALAGTRGAVQSREQARASSGLSAHIWVENKLGNCPCLPMLNQLPDIVRKSNSAEYLKLREH